MTKHSQQKIAFAFGVVFIAALLVLAVAFPTPTPFQYLVFRIVLALATAGVAAMIPGFLEVQLPGWLRAGGALAVFVVVFFYNPAALISEEPPSQPQPGMPFSMTSEMSDFALVSTVEGRYQPEERFLGVVIEKATFTLRDRPQGYNGPRRIRSMRMGVATSLENGGFDVTRFGEWFPIDIVIVPDDTVPLASRRTLIPIAGIGDLSRYWLVAQYASQAEGNESTLGYSYVHSPEPLVTGVPSI